MERIHNSTNKLLPECLIIQGCILNPSSVYDRAFLQKKLNGYMSLIIFTKIVHHRCFIGFELRLWKLLELA